MKEAKMNIDPTLPCAQEMTKKDFPLLQKYAMYLSLSRSLMEDKGCGILLTFFPPKREEREM